MRRLSPPLLVQEPPHDSPHAHGTAALVCSTGCRRPQASFLRPTKPNPTRGEGSGKSASSSTAQAKGCAEMSVVSAMMVLRVHRFEICCVVRWGGGSLAAPPPCPGDMHPQHKMTHACQVHGWPWARDCILVTSAISAQMPFLAVVVCMALSIVYTYGLLAFRYDFVSHRRC